MAEGEKKAKKGAKDVRKIEVGYLARVEGEGALVIRWEDGTPVEAKLKIFEPPRFFEGLLRGRAQTEVPDITARICGICPVAYQMSACHAVEDALGVKVEGELRRLRRLLYCGEWIESHVLHIFLLHAPDFLGYDDGMKMAKDHPELVRNGLRMKKAGNAIVRALGGREIHPINVRVGGFYRAPRRAELEGLLDELRWARDATVDAARFLAGLDFPDLERDWELVSLRHPDEYPMNEGRVVSSRGLDIDVHDYEAHFVEEHVAHSTALHSRRRGGGSFHVGPMARVANNFDRLSPAIQALAREVGLEPSCRNPFKSILARTVETLFAFEEAIAIIESYQPPPAPSVEIPRRVGVGRAATEAPRGLLYHRYAVDADGKIRDAQIVPPTSQNQRSIEEDLLALAPDLLDLPDEEASWRAEQAVRNYDPCISCSTHFLTLRMEGQTGRER